jgi:hypothetical protein
VINDNVDVTLRGNIYSYGGWSVNLTPTYRRRYKYNGAFGFNLQQTKLNFKGDPDFQKSKTFNVNGVTRLISGHGQVPLFQQMLTQALPSITVLYPITIPSIFKTSYILPLLTQKRGKTNLST